MTNEQKDRQIEITIAQQVCFWQWCCYPGNEKSDAYCTLESPETVNSLKRQSDRKGWGMEVCDEPWEHVEDRNTDHVPKYLSNASDDVAVLHQANASKDQGFRQRCRWWLARLWFERKTGKPYTGSVVDLRPYADPMLYLPGDWTRAVYQTLEQDKAIEKAAKTAVESGAAD